MKNSTISGLEENVRDLEQQLAESKDELEELKKELKQLQDSVISGLKVDVRTLNEELTASKGELETLKNQGFVMSNLQENVRNLAESKGELVKKPRVRMGALDGIFENDLTITVELNGVESLLSPGSTQEKKSQPFYSGGELEIIR